MAYTDIEDPVRTANDRIYSRLWSLGEPGGAFLCECRTFCTDEVQMTLFEYTRLRGRRETLLAPGHGEPIRSRT